MPHSARATARSPEVEASHRLVFPGCPTDSVSVADVQRWLDSLPPLYPNPMESKDSGPVAAWLYYRALKLVQLGLQSLDNQNWRTARLLCCAADALLETEDAAAAQRDARYGSGPKPPRERAGRLFATLAHARIDLLALPDGLARTGVSNALDDAELLARDVIDNPIPENVLAALNRMCTPLDESVLKGATARADAHSMQTIREYVLAGNHDDTPGA
ncbi:hypothetical protein [Paraburkholderia sp. J94]|uniref:hypothetical protein n=1 Tax=Paraburkholderia sp. J94 TaxID=2805441 RepID=UPI002AAF6EE0|nr:hypothetical protein [Paraburkholderia sp. J94]